MPVHAHGACDIKYDIRMKESCKTDCRFEFLVEFCVYSDIGHVTSVTSVTFVTSACNVCNVCNVRNVRNMFLRPVFDEESESAIRFGPFLHPDSVLTQTPRTFRTSPVEAPHMRLACGAC